MSKDNPITASIAALIANPASTKDQAYQLGYDAGRLAGIIETNELFDKVLRENLLKPALVAGDLR
jgi:hypothetical protein